MHHKRRPAGPAPSTHGCTKVRAPAQSVTRGKHGQPPSLPSGAEPRATLRPPRGDDGSAGPGPHAQPESMGLGPPTIVRLERTLTHSRAPDRARDGRRQPPPDAHGLVRALGPDQPKLGDPERGHAALAADDFSRLTVRGEAPNGQTSRPMKINRLMLPSNASDDARGHAGVHEKSAVHNGLKRRPGVVTVREPGLPHASQSRSRRRGACPVRGGSSAAPHVVCTSCGHRMDNAVDWSPARVSGSTVST